MNLNLQHMELFALLMSILISLVFLLAGTMKLVKSHETLRGNLRWTSEKSTLYLNFISWAEIIGALLFFIPYQFSVLPFLSVIAAFVLVVLMIGAPITHLRLGEHKEAALTTFLLIMILLVTFIRIFY